MFASKLDVILPQFTFFTDLFEYPRIIHRDINSMLRKEGDNVDVVSNDFDLAVFRDVQSSSSKQRTGTKPFMAIDLLQRNAAVHMYRHDLESMFYVLVWIASHFHNGKEIANTSLQESAEKDDVNLLGRKWVFITYEHPPPTPTPQFEPLERHSGFYNRERCI